MSVGQNLGEAKAMEAELFGRNQGPLDESESGENDGNEQLPVSLCRDRAPKPKTSKKKKGSSAVRVNLSACKYDILRLVIKNLGWKEVGDEDEWQLYWTDTSVSLERVMKLKKTQKINHFCGMLEICRKKKLANNIARMAKLAEKEYDFHPSTYNLPDDLPEFMDVLKSKKKKTFILKPDAGCQGKGIRLVQSSKDVTKALEELGTTTNVVAQKYIAKPFLIDDLKFDLRIYVMIASCDPLRIYIFEEGLARFCTEKYEAPKTGNLATVYMHLTNYAVNKRNENYKFNEDEAADDEGSKWSLTALREWMASHGHDYDKAWSSICDVAVKTVISIQPLLAHNYRSVLGYENEGFSCFEVLGMDIMLDSKLKPWLIECNHSPSFGVDTPLDMHIKEALITQTLRLASLDVRAIKKQKKEDRKAAESRLYGRSKGLCTVKRAMTSEEVDVLRASVLEKRVKWEQTVLPDSMYHMIYPPVDVEQQQKYECLLKLSSQLFERSAASRTNATINAVASKKKSEAEESEAAERRRKVVGGRSGGVGAKGGSGQSLSSHAGAAGRTSSNDTNTHDDMLSSPLSIDSGSARAGWAAIQPANLDTLDSWQDMQPTDYTGSAYYPFTVSQRNPSSGKGRRNSYNLPELHAGDDLSRHGLFAYDSFSPLLQSPTKHTSYRELRTPRPVDDKLTTQEHALPPENGGSSQGRRLLAPTVPTAKVIPAPFANSANEVYGPIIDSFPQRQSGRLRPADVSVMRGTSQTGSGRYAYSANSRPGSGSGYRILLPTAAASATTPVSGALNKHDASIALGMESGRMEDVLDDYMQTYGVTRHWSGSSGTAHPLPAPTANSAATNRLLNEGVGKTVTPSKSLPPADGAAGLTIRGIRPQ